MIASCGGRSGDAGVAVGCKGKWFVGVMVKGTAALFWFSAWIHKKACEVYHRNIIKHRPLR